MWPSDWMNLIVEHLSTYPAGKTTQESFIHVSSNLMRASPCMFHACPTYNVDACFMFHAWNMHGTCEKMNVFHACDMCEPCMLHEWHSCHECTVREPCMHGPAVEKAFCCVQVSCIEACM